MKNLAKIFMTVVALFAFACTTDTTYDPTVELGAGQTTVTLSLDDENDTVESRTHITGKDGEKYPLYWSNGDQIALNGVASNPLEITEGVHTNKAVFTVEGDHGYPRSIVYPAPAEGVTKETEGCYPVTFMAEQPYTVGTFAEGSTPMYAYVNESGESEGLQHLAGVLRFDVKAPAQTTTEGETTTETKTVTLKAMVVEVEGGKIAGNFDVNCATGEVTPHADATNTVTVTFPEGKLDLSTTATPIYVAVPAGEYGTATISLYTNEGFMRGTFSTNGERVVKPGVIFEFGEVEYLNKTEEGTFLIYDEATLRNFATRVNNKEENFDTNYTTAKVVANIKLTEPWESINGFAGTFDGGNHTISNLDAPLFSTTQAAAIQNVKLTEVNIESGNADVAALACVINNTQATVTNCSAVGKITVVGNDPKAVTDSVLHYASLVGYSTSTQKFSQLYTNVKYEITGQFNVKMRAANTISHMKGSLEDVTNHGTLTFNATNTKELQFGGITYYCELGHKNCTNGSDEDATGSIGAITIKGDPQSEVNVAGVIYYSGLNVENCHNYGNIDVDVTHSTTIYVGGVTRLAKSTAKDATICITDCSNHGDITISGTTDICLVAGILTEDEGSKYPFHIKACNNHGSITLEDGFKSTKNAYVGGVVAVRDNSCTTTIESTENHGAITFNGGVETSIWVGGVVGVVPNKNVTSGDGVTPVLVLKSCANRGSISVNGSATDYVRVGGILGATSCDLGSDSSGDIENHADISCSTTNTGTTRVAGWCGSTGSDFVFENMKLFNYGDVKCSATGSKVIVSGIAYSTTNIGNATCFCNIEAKGLTDVAMVSANTRGTNRVVTNCNIGGTIWKGDMTEAENVTLDNYATFIYVGGVEVGSDNEKLVVNTDNCRWLKTKDATPQRKDIPDSTISTAADLIAWAVAETTATSTEVVALGADIDLNAVGIDWTPFGEDATGWKSIEGFNGVFDGGNHEIKGLTAPLFGTTQAAEIKNVKLTGVKISTTISGSVETNYGALACYVKNADAILSNCSASGSMTLTTNEATSATSAFAGLIGRSKTKQTLSGLVNSVNLTVDGTYGGTLIVAGCLASSDDSVTPLENCHNLGTISFVGTAKGNLYIHGFVGGTGNLNNCVNGSKDDATHQLGKVSFAGTLDGDKVVMIGGLTGAGTNPRTLITNCANYGNVEVGGNQLDSGNKQRMLVGGLTSVARASEKIECCYNHGDITVSIDRGDSSQLTSISGIGGIWDNSNPALIKDCTNYGKITVTSNAKLGGVLRIGGITERTAETLVSLENVHNEGDIEMAGTVTGECYMAGVVGFLNKDTTISKGASNTGVITCSGTCSSNITSVAGVIAAATEKTLTLADGVSLNNSGAINVTGKFKDVAVGGVFGRLAKDISAKILNTGDVTYSGTKHADVADADYKVYVGGVAGALSSTLSGARCYCTVTALGYQNVGMITGSAYSEATKVTNCHIGGTLYRGGVLPEENSSTVIDLNEYKMDIVVYNSDWKAYIYQRGIYGVPMGSEPIDISIAVADGCGVLSESVDSDPEIPEL